MTSCSYHPALLINVVAVTRTSLSESVSCVFVPHELSRLPILTSFPVFFISLSAHVALMSVLPFQQEKTCVAGVSYPHTGHSTHFFLFVFGTPALFFALGRVPHTESESCEIPCALSILAKSLLRFPGFFLSSPPHARFFPEPCSHPLAKVFPLVR